MSKGTWHRKPKISREEFEDNWTTIFGSCEPRNTARDEQGDHYVVDIFDIVQRHIKAKLESEAFKRAAAQLKEQPLRDAIEWKDES